MMTRRVLACALVAALTACCSCAQAMEKNGHQDTVTFTLSTEDWVTAKTARVIIGVEAAVSGAAAGSARGDMLKAVENVAKSDWKLTGFSRAQDQTGLERWSASFEARLPENALGGLHEAAKKAGKAGMQLSVNAIDFSPTLDETESARAVLRAKLYKSAAEQLTALNAALPNRDYRIAEITFLDTGNAQPYAQNEIVTTRQRMVAMPSDATMSPVPVGAPKAMERSEKISVSAMVVMASLPPLPPQHGADREMKR